MRYVNRLFTYLLTCNMLLHYRVKVEIQKCYQIFMLKMTI